MASVQMMDAVIEKYVGSIGKAMDELKEVRIVGAPDSPTGPIAWDAELVFGNRWVSYTRVAKFWLNETIHFKSITQKTRLHVPASEVPEGAQFYRGPRGPYIKSTTATGAVQGGEPATIEPAPWSTVECAFCYVRGEGAMAGEKIWVSEQALVAKVGQDGLERLVGGCKFDFWALCHELATGRPSTFSRGS